MKRCPDCGRNYNDDSMSFCLDDGAELLFGPASASVGDEPATAILHSTAAPGEAPTLAQISTTNETARLPSDSMPRPASSAEYLVSQVKQHKFGAVLIMTLAVFVVAGLGFGIYKLAGGKKAEVSFESAKITRVTSTGKATIASISPDGKYIVHAVADAGKESLWVRQTLTGSNVQIVTPAEISYRGITFSHDGNFVYYVAGGVGVGFRFLYRVPVLGGTPVTLVKDVDSPITISPDGSQMAFLRTALDSSGLFVANIEGTAEREIAKRDNPARLRGGPAWSPDGKTVVCSLRGTEATSLLSVRVSDGVTTPLTQKSWDAVGQVAWLNDDTLILNGTDRNSSGGLQLWSLSLSSGQATPITRDLNNYSNVSLSPDSNTLVTVQSEGQSNVFLAQAGNEAESRQLTTGKGSDGAYVSWTADGMVLYDSNANGNWDVFRVKTDGSEQQRLTNDPKFDYLPTASGDGRYIVFRSNRTGPFELWRMNSDGRNPIQLATGGGLLGSFSPDGKWFLYSLASNDSRIFKISIDGGEPEPVGDDNPEYYPVVSPDGQMIAYWSFAGLQNGGLHRLRIMPFSGGPAVTTFEIPPTVYSADAGGNRIQFSANGQTIFYLDTQNGVSNIWSQPVTGGQPKQITKFKAGKILSFAYSPDGKQLAFAKGETTNDVVMISGFKK